MPASRVNTSESRSRLPEFIRHEEATEAAARAALLGAGIASGDPELLASAFHDRLHEPFRAPDAPLLGELRESPVTGQVGVTLSGSGPTVVVWAEKAKAEAAAAELEERAPDAQVLPLAIAARGTLRGTASDHREPADWSSDMSVYTKPTDPAKRHSAALTDGVDRAPARAMLKAVGFTDDDLAKPLVGVAHDVDRDDAVQLQPAGAREARQGRHPRRRRHADRVQHGRRSPTASRWGRPACAPR